MNNNFIITDIERVIYIDKNEYPQKKLQFPGNLYHNELTKLTLEGKMYAYSKETEFDREDLFLSKQQREAKRLCEFILNQEPVLTEYSKMT